MKYNIFGCICTSGCECTRRIVMKKYMEERYLFGIALGQKRSIICYVSVCERSVWRSFYGATENPTSIWDCHIFQVWAEFKMKVEINCSILKSKNIFGLKVDVLEFQCIDYFACIELMVWLITQKEK